MSITNFYYFDKAKVDNNVQKVSAENAVIADSDMRVVKAWSGLPFKEGESLLSLFYGEEERLFTVIKGMSKLIRAHVESEPFDTELICEDNAYIITLLEYAPPEEERYAELERLSSGDFPTHIRECADAYRRLITNETGPLFTENICSLMDRISAIANCVKRDIIASPVIKGESGTGVIKYSEKDFFRLIITAVSVCLSMSGREDIKMQCRIGNIVAGFGAVFKSPLPDEIITFLTNGRYDTLPFDSEYGSIFLMLSYIKRLCLLYGYSVAVEMKPDGFLSLGITLPFVTQRDAPAISLKEQFNKEWATEVAKRMLIHNP